MKLTPTVKQSEDDVAKRSYKGFATFGQYQQCPMPVQRQLV